ncbi:GntR family transcriptional regulator [Kribbella sp. NBC_00709]|uniref:GntR family transcriptional regulator n=1 Tax=Kribbella sp. NBC_00709 TaxID=2975972 RepID=UPI002E2A7686|nr:GntR family transcriptional regulator [Kribbella sp. NBC_00709]
MPVTGRIPALSRGTTAEEVASVLREMIMSGALMPGAQLREETLAEQFDVSRRTVKDALGVLGRERIVRHYRHRGSRVVLFSEEDIRDLYRVRRTLEGSAARRAEDLTDADLRGLGEAFAALTAATRAGDAAEIVRADLAFHQAVVGLNGSPRVDEFFAGVAVEMRYALSILESTYQESSRRPAAALTEHGNILAAFQKRDADRAARLLEQHADANEELLVTAIGNLDVTEFGAH